jgi:hypothetical protein
MVTGHGKRRSYLQRFKIIETPIYPCGTAEQIIDNLLSECELINRERDNLISAVFKRAFWTISKNRLITKHFKIFAKYIHTYIHTHTNIHIHTRIHKYRHTYTHTYIHTYKYTYTHMHAYTQIYIHTHMYIHTFIHIYIHTYILVRNTCNVTAKTNINQHL